MYIKDVLRIYHGLYTVRVIGSPCIWAGSIGTETSDARRLKTLAPAPT